MPIRIPLPGQGKRDFFVIDPSEDKYNKILFQELSKLADDPLQGRAIPQVEFGTWNRKRKKGLPSKPMMETGELLSGGNNGFRVEFSGKEVVVTSPARHYMQKQKQYFTRIFAAKDVWRKVYRTSFRYIREVLLKGLK